MTREVRFGSRRIRYALRQSSRKTLAIAVHADGRVTVRVPLGTRGPTADARVARRSAWILKQQRRVSDGYERAKRRYVSGASVHLLGRELMLRVRKARATTITLDRPYLRVATPDTREACVERIVREWQRLLARDRFVAALARLTPLVRGRASAPPVWRLVDMKRRWGSCSRRGKLSLNPRLIEHPAGCIEYVVLHELCHLKHLGHGREFRSLLGRLLPEWQRWKRRLDGGRVL